jgi:hypothetical protein
MQGDAEQLFRSITRLVPNSGVQFIDIQLPRRSIETVARHFVQERVQVGDQAMWGLAPVTAAGAQAPDNADLNQRIGVTGRMAVTAVLNQWLPIPLLRLIARDGEGRFQFDDGPYNWARVYLAQHPDDADTGVLRGVIAIDTQIDTASRLDLAAYAAPTLDDVRFSSTFALTDDAEHLAPFLAEEWLQSWIQAAFPVPKTGGKASAPAAAGLHQMAAYLTLLTILRRAAVLPSLQFNEVRPDVVPPIPVDLVFDIGASRSCAMLVESATAHGRPNIANSTILTLRDLSNPIQRQSATFESCLTFARANFGSEIFSRKSGRVEAFNWPSLARTGAEAVRLRTASKAEDGATGMASPKTHLRDVAPRDEIWRFTADPRIGIRRSQMLAGRLLSHVSATAGLLTGPSGSVQQIALRPRHSLSAMMSFFVAEVVLQALANINAPRLTPGTEAETTTPDGAWGAGDGVRYLRQIIVCAPLTMPLDERDMLRERAEAAIDMLWRSLNWDDQPVDFAPQRPLVRLGLDETLSAQLVYLFDEIAHRFAGEPRAFLDVMGKNRPEFGVQPCIRLAALDIGGGHANMTIVTYASSGNAPIAPHLLGAQRSNLGGDAVLDRIVADIIEPAVVLALTKAGVVDADVFWSRHATVTEGSYNVASLAQRLHDHWLRPAAIALLKVSAGLSANASPVAVVITLRDLALRDGDFNIHAAKELALAAETAGAVGFDLGSVALTQRPTQIAAAAREALAPMIANLSRAIVASDCDVVLLTGWAGRLRAVKDLLLEVMPWRPDRIIALHERDWQDWYPMSETERDAADGKDIGLIGALLALAGGERLGFGSGESGFPFAAGGFDQGAPSPADADAWQAAATARGGR